MSVRVAINGFGRIGRCFLRAAHENGADIEVVAVNDLMEAGTLAQLLKYDSVFGRFPGDVAAGNGGLVVGESHIGPSLSAIRSPCPGRNSASMS